MNQLEFKKFPVLATVLTVICLLLAVIGIAASLAVDVFVQSPVLLGLLLVVASVLVIAGLTTGRVLLLRIISIIIFGAVLTVNFVLTITKFGERNVFLFAMALLMLVVCVLTFVYFLTIRNGRIKKMFYIADISLAGLTFLYAVIFIIQDIVDGIQFNDAIEYPAYFLLLGYAVISCLPAAIFYSLTKKEEQPKQEN